MKRLTLLFLHLILLLLPAYASVEVRSVQLTTEEGMANNTVRHIFQDSKGFIWMGTLNGLNRYDGNSFVTFRPEGSDKVSLADHRVKYIKEDENGFLWISTTPDLISCYDLKRDCFVDYTGCGEYNQYYSSSLITRSGDVWLWQNGNGCRKVMHDSEVFTSIAFKEENNNLLSNQVKYVFEDAQGVIWVGSDEGLSRIEGEKTVLVKSDHDAFAALSYGKQNFFLSADGTIVVQKEGVSEERVIQLTHQSRLQVYGSLQLQQDWVIFTNYGGFVFQLETHQVTKDATFDIPNGQVQRDNKGNYWVYNFTGKVWYIDAKSRAVKNFQLISSDKINYIDQERYHVVQDGRGIIWISTYGNGLFAYNPTTDSLQHFMADIHGFSHLSSNYLQNIMEDRAGNIWVCSEYTGVTRLSIMNEGADRIFFERENLSDRVNTVRMMKQMENGEIYIGTRRGGLYRYNNQLQLQGQKEYHSSSIYAIERDLAGKLWMGTRGNGLSIDGKWYEHDPLNPHSLGDNNIFAFCRDKKGRMWVGTFGGGLNLALPEGDTYHFRRYFQKSYGEKQIRTILEDREGWMWVGTSEGVHIFHPDSLIANPDAYYSYSYNNGKLRSNEIKCLWQDFKGGMWVGTAGAGMSVCTPSQDYDNLNFTHYDTTNGLVGNMIQSIVEDRDYKLWVATEYGISRFDPEANAAENFFFSTYALGNVYSENSALVTKDGRILVGTNYGMVIITPQKVVNRFKTVPHVSFTNLLINGMVVKPGEVESPLTTSMVYTDQFELMYNQNSLTIEFSTFDYSYMEGTKYRYKLENYDTEWSTPSAVNMASYKNLLPGHYRFHVKACNDAGVWGDKESLLLIHIKPPYWRTYWAYLLYIVCSVIIFFFVFRLVRNMNVLRNKVAVEKQLTEYKLVFFTNISHEFRTPLSLIQGALEGMKQGAKIPKEMTYSFKVMEKSTERMLRLINQLLEFRKMQNNKLSLSLEETDVVAFIREIFISFNDVSQSKGMEYQFYTSHPTYRMFVDKGKVDKVAYNLLSNAFKYTPSGGRIVVNVMIDEAAGTFSLEVADSGVGVPKDKQADLFTRFMQSQFSSSSMGVGLHLSHELATVHRGTISYKEQEGGGSLFTLLLPVDSSIYSPSDFLIETPVLLEEQLQEGGAITELEEYAVSADPLNKRKVLIIEDDTDVREFLKEEVGKYFEVIAEADGIAGVERARCYDADLIICDVLMPGLNGYEVVKRLRDDFETSHIPIILLTAMSSTDNHLQGIESGADAYITKPFSPKLLLTRAFKLIEQRDKLRKKFSNSSAPDQVVIYTSDRDKEFSEQLQKLMDEQLDNPLFTVDEFASLMGLGRTVFYRKVRAITGYSPNEFIRVRRMKRGAELLLENKYTVAEVSYKVGINDPFYFSKCFKQQFGVAPSIYQKGK